MSCLKRLEEEAGHEWVETIEGIYGVEWLSPFRTILEHERDRATKRGGQEK